MRSRFYQGVGFAVWKMAMLYVRQRFGGFRKPVAAFTVVAAIAVLYVVNRDD